MESPKATVLIYIECEMDLNDCINEVLAYLAPEPMRKPEVNHIHDIYVEEFVGWDDF
jgi:hypothetical protein